MLILRTGQRTSYRGHPRGGDSEAFGEALALARIDWRDLLVSAGLADEDWPAELDYRIGPD